MRQVVLARYKISIVLSVCAGLLGVVLYAPTAQAAPPDTVFDVVTPQRYTTNTAADFEFSSSDPAATFECRLDSDPFAACVSPLNLTGLTTGDHSFEVRSTNLSAETDMSPAIYSWTVVAFDGGDGSSTPYQISTCVQLQTIDDDLAADYELVDNVDCDGFVFQAIGLTSPFTGNFNGQGYEISNLSITASSFTGLFAEASGATIENLYATNFTISGQDYTAAIVGLAGSSTAIQNVRVSDSTVTATGDRVGGVIGSLVSATAYTNSFQGLVTTSGQYVGGLIGYAVGPTMINNNFARSTLSGVDYVGGLVGYFGVGAGSAINYAYAVTNFTSSTGTRDGITAFIGSGNLVQYTFSVTNLSGSMESGDEYKNNTSNAPLSTWSFGPSGTWHVNYNDFPSLTPLQDPVYYCDQSVQTLTSITAACDYAPSGWGTTTWEAAYQESGAADWTSVTLPDIHQARVTISGASPFNEYKIRFRFTNDWGTGPWAVAEFVQFDTDNDGVNDLVESSGPNSGDANSDGTPDYQQANVYSTISPTNNKYVVLTLQPCVDVFNGAVGGESSSPADAESNYPAGLIAFVGRSCGAAGASVPVQIYFFGDYASANLRLKKYVDGSYIPVEGAHLSDVTIGGQKAVKATYTIVDGGPLDDDGLADGNIVDPVGLATVAVAAPATGLTRVSSQSLLTQITAIIGLLGLGGYLLRQKNL